MPSQRTNYVFSEWSVHAPDLGSAEPVAALVEALAEASKPHNGMVPLSVTFELRGLDDRHAVPHIVIRADYERVS